MKSIAPDDETEPLLSAVGERDGDAIVVLYETVQLVAPDDRHPRFLGELDEPFQQDVPAEGHHAKAAGLSELLRKIARAK